MTQDINHLVQQGLAHHQAGRLADAEALYRTALSRDPNRIDAMQLLGLIACQVGRNDAAVELIGAAVRAWPTNALFHNNLGTAYRGLGQLDHAITCYRRSIELDNTDASVFMNLLRSLIDEHRLEEAIAIRDQAAHLGHDTASQSAALLALEGNQLHADGHLNEALKCHETALAISPEIPQLHWNRALMLLTLGDYLEGWKEYEWRFQCDNFPYKRQKFPQPMWDGSDLSGKRLFLDAEGGFGDIIQFVRYAKLLADLGAVVIVGCPPEVKEILRTVAGVHQIITKGDPLPEFDLQLPLLSCPARFGTTLETIPNPGAYITARPERAALFRKAIRGDKSERQIGLVWAGRSMPYPNRTCPLANCQPLFDLQGMRFHSLQRDDGIAELASAPKSWNLVNHAVELIDFSATAAIVENLDLVITIDSGVAHLAGSMGKPVFVMLPFSADWRWGTERHDCPWYPAMRLFRQPKAGDWRSVTELVATALLQAGTVSPRCL
jgi:hypothetical protein